MTNSTVSRIQGPGGELLKPAEVAVLFRVDPKTISRWAKNGKLPYVRTIGGHRRYRLGDVQALLKFAEPSD